MTLPAGILRRFLLVAISVVAPGPLSAQQSNLPAAGTTAESQQAKAADAEKNEAQPSLEELQSRLAKLLSELEQAKAASKTSDQRRETELAELTADRGELADQLLELQIEKERNAGQRDALQSQAENAAVEAEAVAAQAAALPRALRDAGEQLRVHLREVPGSDAQSAQLQQAVATIDAWPAVDSDQSVAAVKSLFAVFSAVHEQAYRVTVREVNLFTAGGQREDVKLLSLGQSRFAYQTIADGRVGLALSSPRDISGYRWSDNLNAQQQQLVRTAIADVESNQAALIALPVDPVGRVRPESLNERVGLWQRLQDGGLVMYPLLGLALVALLLICERALLFYVGNRSANGLVQAVLDACRTGQFATAEQTCQEGRGAVSRVLSACLRRRTQGQRAMEDSIQEQLLHELPLLQRFMGGIATLAAVAPLLGLLGTVTGIIRTFGVIRAFGNANPSLMAGGISEALLTTASGLVIAVPILIIHSMLRGRSERIMADAERYAANLLTVLVHDQAQATDGRFDVIPRDQREAALKETTPAGETSVRRTGKEVVVD